MASFQESYFSPSEVFDQNRYPLNKINDSKAVTLSIVNFCYLLFFLGTMLFICVVTIPINNIFDLISATLYE